ncbi:hypothetical protein ElyMa_002507700 [Elysia marginata]|uniref:Uncharacterized protein n=1 Tax=Elysia marginata TaxID=1093978 RepID=A0AAV4GU23_9GAST|nr:hypothetical protein ElyMa_002507700 [Elysia marginata]
MDVMLESQTSMSPIGAIDWNDTWIYDNDSTTVKPEEPLLTSEVIEREGNRTSIQSQLPLIVGVAVGAFGLVLVVSTVAYKASKQQRRKQQKKEEEEQLNIITEFVETSLSG